MANTNLILKPGDTLSVTAEATIPVPPVNIPPIVSAGSNQTIKLPLNKVTLVGAVSDPDGIASGLVVVWAKVSGLAATIGTVNAVSTEVSNLVEGVYIFRLTATDPKGGVTSSVVTVTVLKADTPPVPGKVDYMNLPIVGQVDLSGRSNVVFENKRIVSASDVAMKLYNGANNITIRNCFFDGGAKELVELENARNITIENCLFAKGFAGVYAVGSSNIKIINCQFLNMRIRWNGAQFQGRGVFVQFNSCNVGEISGCKGENFADESDPEDMISCYASSDITIKNNILRGGVSTKTKADPSNPSKQIPVSSTSGGGIIIGDNGGSNCVVDSNSLLTPGQYGCAIAGGVNMKMTNNKIYTERNLVSNNPLYAWAQGNQVGKSSNATVTGNRGKWIDKNGGTNNGWDGDKNISNLVFQYLTPITIGEMGVPDHLIDMVTPAELLKIRGK